MKKQLQNPQTTKKTRTRRVFERKGRKVGKYKRIVCPGKSSLFRCALYLIAPQVTKVVTPIQR